METPFMADIESIHAPHAALGRAQTRAALPPAAEQTILFGMFTAAAGFWMAVIWWIVR
jgi:hypothetical protein